MTDPRYEGLPATWPIGVLETYARVEEETSSITAAQSAVLFEACSLLARAEGLDAAVAEHGHMTRGSQGQLITNPCIAEARAHRRDALAAIARAGIGTTRSAVSAAGTALASKRWRSG